MDYTFLPKQCNWNNLYFYKKSIVVYDLTFHFTQRFLNVSDRTIDQMVQAARSIKQNIVEGLADGKTSREFEMKLLNVARASNRELIEDYKDYLRVRDKELYQLDEEKFKRLHAFCRSHNEPIDYEQFYDTATDVQLANMALTLSYSIDTMLHRFIQIKQQEFVKEGGIKEQMTAARLGYRHQQQNSTVQQALLREQQAKITALEAEIVTLKQELEKTRRH